ncbi:MAG: peptidylprolyl isomerase [Pseudopedobacter saltans]|uniref:Periplasmic chaperone PpiD n=1 Tax=Pseudopedobacter saltans TaxID=151895 RepID=A0A2W5F418_9SPHI|nr:MAG: peptidylprolyl isomerase [Pseudopedobacter saltans]
MSIIQKIQEKGAWIIVVLIALSLIAFILMDSSFSRGNLFSNTTTVGKINGQKIEKTDFDSQLDMVSKMQSQQGQQPQREQLIGQVWNYEVQLTTLKQQAALLGLGFTDAELESALFGNNPPPFMKQQFTDPKTGIYDANAARQALAQAKKQINNPQIQEFEQSQILPLIDQSIAQKYQALIVGAIYVPKWLGEKEATDASTQASFDYVEVPYSSIPDDQVKVSDAEIMAYVNKHPKQFEQKFETRNISYVAFDAAPTSADSSAVRSEVNALKEGFIAATDAKAFLNANGGEVPYYGGYMAGKSIQDPFKDSIIHNPVGTVYGPYSDQQNYVLAKLVAAAPIADTVNVRHILVATQSRDPQTGSAVTVRTDSAALKRLDSAIAAINSGAKFDSICAKYSDDPGSKDNGGLYENLTTGKMVPEFNDFAFTGAVGEKKTIKTDFGYHYVEVLSRKGSDMGYKIAYIGKPIEASSNTINNASNQASQFAALSPDNKAFTENAAKSKLTVTPLASIQQNDYSVGQLGANRTFVKWIFENKVGSVSAPTQVGDKYLVAVITGIQKPGLLDAAAARQYVEPIVRNEKKAQMIISTKFKGNTLESYAQSAGVQILHADSAFFASPFIKNVGNEPKVIGAAFNKNLLNKASTPIAGTAGVFAVLSKGVSAAAGMSGTPDQVRAQLRQSMLQQVGQSAFGALVESADIKDYRSIFY